MSSIFIRNIGPLTNIGPIDLGRFNVIIGKQSSGKSTLMKILCFCQWLEKKIMTGNDKELIYNYTHYNRFLRELKQFHRFPDDYFVSQSEIVYIGESLKIALNGDKKNVQILRNNEFNHIRQNTKLCYIPSERNLVSAIKNIDRAYKSNDYDVLFNHIFEWSEAHEYYTEEHPIDLSIVGNMNYYYDPTLGDIVYLKDKQKKISPFYVSSGVQSVLPIIVMAQYFTGPIFTNIVNLSRNDITVLLDQLSRSAKDNPKEFKAILNKVALIYNYQNTKLFIEEPEQNLFPESQQALINFIVERINVATAQTGKPSSVTITTHSPYVITAFNVLLKAAFAKEKNAGETYKIVPKNAIIPFEDLCAYYIDERGVLSNIADKTLQMIGGAELDHASDIVEDKLSLLNDVIYGSSED